MSKSATLFYNCRLLRAHEIVKDDLWVCEGKIINPAHQQYGFVDEVDCGGRLIVPGFIDLKLNGAFGVDFSNFGDDSTDDWSDAIQKGVEQVARCLPSIGVTSFCPTIVTTSPSTYRKILPHLKRKPGPINGATLLGTHVDGPFISRTGGHDAEHVQSFGEADGLGKLLEVYGSLENIKVVTMAPELEGAAEVITALTKRGVVVSLGHSGANLVEAERAVEAGASMISHLFNTMPNFHHRDPSLIGLLASDLVDSLPRKVHFGIIADGVHVHPAALRMAAKIAPDNLVLISDAIAPMGLAAGRYNVSGREIDVRNGPKKSCLAGTDTLFGSVATFDSCVRNFCKATNCSLQYAVEAASLRPAQCLGLEGKKGVLDFEADADFVMLDQELRVVATYVLGNRVYARIS